MLASGEARGVTHERRGLFREAGRAARSFAVRQSLHRRGEVSASADLTLLQIDERLSRLTDPVDVSSMLTP
jgi:hypothetical protein